MRTEHEVREYPVQGAVGVINSGGNPIFLVEAFDDQGLPRRAYFTGPEAEDRARAYAKRMSKVKAE